MISLAELLLLALINRNKSTTIQTCLLLRTEKSRADNEKELIKKIKQNSIQEVLKRFLEYENRLISDAFLLPFLVSLFLVSMQSKNHFLHVSEAKAMLKELLKNFQFGLHPSGS